LQVVKNLPIVFLTLLAGCTEQPPLVSEAPVTVVEIVAEDSPGLVTDIVEPRNEADLIEVVEHVAAQTLYKVIKVVDGDTIDVLTDDKETIRLRFNGIDTPERGQPFGNNATKFVSDTVGGKMVRLVTHGEDRYDRTID
jgi:endonuclease YncB( thermonuclease family)